MNTPFITNSHAEINAVSSPAQTLQSWFNTIFNQIGNGLNFDSNLRIWSECDRHNHTIWYAYDPLTKESVSFSSEAEACRWLEKRYS